MYSLKEFFLEEFLPVCLVFSFIIILVASLIFSLTYFGSCKSAEIFNKQNKTEFTCWDFFWASNQINSQTQTIRLK